MSLGGQNQEAFFGQPSTQVIVYGPDGRMYNNPEQAKAAGVENPTFQPPANVAPAAQVSPGGGYDENGKFISMSPLGRQPSMTPATNSDLYGLTGGKYENGQFTPEPMAPDSSMMTGYGGPEGVMEPFTGAPSGGKGGAMQSRLTPLGSQPFSQPSRSFGGLNRFMPANSMSQYQTPMAMPMPQFGQGGVMDPTAMAQQAILARPMRPSFTGQQLMSREVPVGIQGNSGLAYPSMASTGLLNVPSYTSRYASSDGGGSGGGDYSGPTSTGLDTYGSYNSLSNGLVGAMLGNSSQPSYGVTVDNMGTYADQPGFGYGSGMTGVGNPGESDFGGYTSSDNGIGNPGESGGYGGYGGTSSDTGTGNPGESDGGGYGGDSGGYGGGDSGGYGGGDSGGSGSGGGSDGGSDGGGGGWAKGGRVTKDRLKGRNPKGPDDGYGALEEGEYVIRKKAVQKYGDGLMSMINSGKFKGY